MNLLKCVSINLIDLYQKNWSFKKEKKIEKCMNPIMAVGVLFNINFIGILRHKPFLQSTL